jgi:Ni,Fe-hydrogenase III component G
MMGAGWPYLSAITGLDEPPSTGEGEPEQEGQIELLYHFCRGPYILTLRIRLPYSRPVVPSVCSLIPYATLYERELIEMFGVEIEGTPSKARLLLPDDWPEGVYPLRKSFKGL